MSARRPRSGERSAPSPPRAHRATVALYEERAREYWERRRERTSESAAAWSERVSAEGGPVLDAGCGPGLDLPGLPTPVLALDAAGSMLRLARDARPDALLVQADLAALPIRDQALRGCWSRQSHLHLRRTDLPAALADLHRSLRVGAPLRLQLLSIGDSAERSSASPTNDDFPGRFFASWSDASARRAVEGAGFAVDDLSVTPNPDRTSRVRVEGTRLRTLPDYVAGDMRVLFCGLNPSFHAADAGYGYAGPGNRFWPAVVRAGLTRHERDPWRALRHDGVGMTDLVKRATRRAAELSTDEYRRGVERIRWVVDETRPRVVCFVGLSGYRAAIDRRAVAGWQDRAFGHVPVYVMPSTSGLNTHATFDDLVGHLRRVEQEAP